MTDLEQAWQERDNWKNDALERQRNTEYYQALIDEIGGHLGEEAFICDDGSKSDSVLRAKVPELVERLGIECAVAIADGKAAFELGVELRYRAVKAERENQRLLRVIELKEIELP